MQHPLAFVPNHDRKRIFFALLFLTLVLFAVFRILDAPLKTSSAPNGIVSFELAHEPLFAFWILFEWARDPQFYTFLPFAPAYTASPQFVYVAFGLGLDYLFMPAYAFTLALGTLLAAERHAGWFRQLGALAGFGPLAAAVFDAVENYALFQVLLGRVFSPYPEIAFYCASVKFGLLILGIVYALAGWLMPKAR